MSALGTGPRSSRPLLRRWAAWVNDIIAALINAVVSVPDGLAAAALAGVNPVYGLYTSVAAPIGGSLLVSAHLMQIATTSASALAAGQAISSYPPAQRDRALFLLVLLTGLLLAIFGLLRLGRLVRFVSHAVMIGFLSGVAVVLALDQLAPLLGLNPRGPNEVVQFINLLTQIGQLSLPTLCIGLLAFGIILGLKRTRASRFSSFVAIIVPSLLVALLGLKNVHRVVDVSPVPRGLPMLTLPAFALLTPDLLLSAFAIAVVIALQGAGVSQSVENPDASRVDPSRDLVAQGVANAASSVLSGIPAGGSVGQTALNVNDLRGRTQVGATLIEVLDHYADDLAEVGGRLYLSGVGERVAAQLRSTGKLDLDRGVHIVLADPILGASTAQAGTLARAWLSSTRLGARETQGRRSDSS